MASGGWQSRTEGPKAPERRSSWCGHGPHTCGGRRGLQFWKARLLLHLPHGQSETETPAHAPCFSRTAHGRHRPANLDEGRLTRGPPPRLRRSPGFCGATRHSGDRPWDAAPCTGQPGRARLFCRPSDVSAPPDGLAKAGDPAASPEERDFSK